MARFTTSSREIHDILIAWTALGVALMNIGFQKEIRGSFAVQLFAVFAIAGSSFILHELMHKFTAQHFGYWAEFRLWIWGLFLTLATSVFGFIFAAPGATYFTAKDPTSRNVGLIGLAGPMTNVCLAAGFGVMTLFPGSINSIGAVGMLVNLVLAGFNLLPVNPLDGSKVFSWNKLIWVGVTAPILASIVILLG